MRDPIVWVRTPMQLDDGMYLGLKGATISLLYFGAYRWGCTIAVLGTRWASCINSETWNFGVASYDALRTASLIEPAASVVNQVDCWGRRFLNS